MAAAATVIIGDSPDEEGGGGGRGVGLSDPDSEQCDPVDFTNRPQLTHLGFAHGSNIEGEFSKIALRVVKGGWRNKINTFSLSYKWFKQR